MPEIPLLFTCLNKNENRIYIVLQCMPPVVETSFHANPHFEHLFAIIASLDISFAVLRPPNDPH